MESKILAILHLLKDRKLGTRSQFVQCQNSSYTLCSMEFSNTHTQMSHLPKEGMPSLALKRRNSSTVRFLRYGLGIYLNQTLEEIKTMIEHWIDAIRIEWEEDNEETEVVTHCFWKFDDCDRLVVFSDDIMGEKLSIVWKIIFTRNLNIIEHLQSLPEGNLPTKFWFRGQMHNLEVEHYDESDSE